MSKVAEQNSKLKRAIILSVVLHILLFGLLIWSSFDQHIDASSGGGGSDIDAVMVDPGAVVEQYNRQQNQQSDSQRAEQLRQQQAKQQAEELQQKQAAELQRLKTLEKERIQAEQDTRQQAAEQKKAQEAAEKAQQQQKQAEDAAAKAKAEAKAQADAQKKAAQEAKQQAAEAKAKAAAEAAKEKAVEEAKAAAQAAKEKAAEEAKAAAQAAKEKAAAEAAKEKATAEAKAKAAAEAKKKAAAEAAKQSSAVDDLLGGLASGSNAPKPGKTAAAAGEGNQKKAGASGAAINSYLGQVQGAIQSKFYDADTFKGKTCSLHIKLAPDGLLISVVPVGGDPALCQAAENAARMARIPKPPSTDVYQAVKEATLDFKP